MMSIWLNLTQFQFQFGFITRNENELCERWKTEYELWEQSIPIRLKGDATKQLHKTIRIKLEDFHTEVAIKFWALRWYTHTRMKYKYKI